LYREDKEDISVEWEKIRVETLKCSDQEISHIVMLRQAVKACQDLFDIVRSTHL
jgi:hypothetical protein